MKPGSNFTACEIILQRRGKVIKRHGSNIPAGIKMDEHGPLKEKIRDCTRYRELVGLRDIIWNLSGKVDFSVYVDLRKRVDDRLEEFAHPVCEEVEIRMFMKEGGTRMLDLRDCRIALGKGKSLSEYILRENPDVEDLEIAPMGTADAKRSPYGSGGPGYANPKLGVLQNKIENVIKLATYMNNTYSKVIPKISADLSDVVSKLELLYSRVASADYEN